MALVLCKPLTKKILQNELLHAAAGPFSGVLDLVKMVLYTVPVAVDPDTVIGDLTQPDVLVWTGYVPQTVVWGGVWTRPDGAFVTQAALLMWQIGAGEAAQNVAGYGIVNTGGTILYALEQFAAPIPLSVSDDALLIGAQLVLGAAADYGSALVEGP